MLRVGIDIGGTFTDFAVWDGASTGYGGIDIFKVPSSPPMFAEGVKAGLERLVADRSLDRNDPMLIVHGTTVSTNAVIERSGPPLGLLITRGFRNVLDIARLRLENPTDLFGRRPDPIIQTRFVYEIDERMLADGSAEAPPSEEGIVAAVGDALSRGAAAIAICFLHSYRNPAHELRAVEIIRKHFGNIDLTRSGEVWPQEGEYERANAALLNAYARTAMVGYLDELQRYLDKQLPQARLLVMKSNGGAMTAAEATRLPIHSLLSGPAGGVTAASTLGQMLDEPNLLTMDMGGTSTDISLIRGGRGVVSHEGKVGDFPIAMPVMAIEAIGAGGGSIAWMDGPLLKVGPRSAGARPGPACYGHGGTLPTLSDAYLLCGYLLEDTPLAGEIWLRRDLAEKAIATVAEPLGYSATAAAESCVTIATSNMLAHALPFIARLGVSPSELTLMIFGGAGAIHGPLLAAEIGIGKVIVPRVSSVFCAFGCLVSDLLYDLVATVRGTSVDGPAVSAKFADLRRSGIEWMQTQAPSIAPRFDYFANIRYSGQSFDVNVAIPEAVAVGGDKPAIAKLFHEEHNRLFKHQHPTRELEILALRVRVRGVLASPSAAPPATSVRQPSTEKRRRMLFKGTWHDALYLLQEELPVGWRAQGPAVIQQETSTTIVPPDFQVEVGPLGDLHLQRVQ